MMRPRCGRELYTSFVNFLFSSNPNDSLTQREPEARETWRAIDKDAEAAFKTSPFAEWDFGAGEAIKNSTKIIKVNPHSLQTLTMLTSVVWSVPTP